MNNGLLERAAKGDPESIERAPSSGCCRPMSGLISRNF